ASIVRRNGSVVPIGPAGTIHRKVYGVYSLVGSMRNSASKEIASAALRLLEKEGVEAVSMRRVAEEVGVTPMAIYHHFPNRDALLRSITDGEFQRLLQFCSRRLRTGRLESALLNILDGYLDYAIAYPNLFDYVFLKPRPDARRFPHDFRARKSP